MLAGSTLWYLPSLIGGELEAKKRYKFHRFGGYLAFLLSWATHAVAVAYGYTGVKPEQQALYMWLAASLVGILGGVVLKVKPSLLMVWK